ncbi:MAG: septum formation protein Maf [Candidatus Wallbacteria bacterium]|nr:septum formation protein Maf [Candidatus Wallbacteria bacterium]
MSVKLILASSSPRRREILRSLGIAFETIDPAAEELDGPRAARLGLAPGQLVRENARRKAEAGRVAFAPAGASAHVRNLFLGVDTIVVKDGIVLSKPGNVSDARRMLSRLQGARHEVLSGLCLASSDGLEVVSSCRTEVEFAPMSGPELDWYLSTGEYSDKAGAYGIQGLASLFVKEIEGCYFNVVGLPVRTLYEALSKLNVPVAGLRTGQGGADR